MLARRLQTIPSQRFTRIWAWCALDPEQSFVLADVPGLIEGAAEGAGLGHLFLRHLSRTKILLHVIDVAPFDTESDPIAQAHALVAELEKYDPALAEKPRWIVLNKMDLVEETEREALIEKYRGSSRPEWRTALCDLGCNA